MTNGKTYYYKVVAVKSGNFPEYGTPSAQFSAAADANGSIDLNWGAVTGATGYMVFRSPNDGDFTFAYCGSSFNMSHDQYCMYLRNGQLYYQRKYTTTGITLTDLGSATERPSGYAYYRDWMNHKTPTRAQCTITIKGGASGSEATFDDIYNASVLHGWNAIDRHYGLDKQFRCFEIFDNIAIEDDFADNSFFVRLHGNLDAGTNDGGSRRFGRIISGTEATICASVISIVSLNRTYYSAISFRNTDLYGTLIASDAVEASMELCADSRSPFYSNSGFLYIYDNVTMLNNAIGYLCQSVQIYGTSGISITQLRQYGVERGLLLNADQTATEFNGVRFLDVSYELTFNVGSTTTTIRNIYLGKNTNLFRFFGASVTSAVGRLINPIFPEGNGLPGSASQGGSAHTNSIEIRYTFNLTVLDLNGNPINSASVTLTDGQGGVTALSTDAFGEIAEQELISVKATRATATDGVFDTLTDYSAYTMVITKNNLRYESALTLDEAKAFTIALVDSDRRSRIRSHNV